VFELEKDVETYFKNKMGELGKGVMCLKFECPGFTGVPDRLILLPGAKVVFAELKKRGKKERARQVYVQGLMKALGFKVFSSVDTKSKVDLVFKYCEEVLSRE
jgi:hypothetical protein